MTPGVLMRRAMRLDMAELMAFWAFVANVFSLGWQMAFFGVDLASDTREVGVDVVVGGLDGDGVSSRLEEEGDCDDDENVRYRIALPLLPLPPGPS